MENIITTVRQRLKENVDEKTLNQGQRFFKEEIVFYGVKIPVVNQISKETFKIIQHKSKKEIFDLCDILWQSGYNEEAYVACNWSYYIRKQYTGDDFAVFEHWVNHYVSNWASCDTLCNHTIGDFIMMYPQYVSNLKDWAKSDNRWTKRAAAVTLIIPARKGMFLDDIFEIAGILLTDKDDMVQKGYGWMLKAASEIYQKEVFDFVISRKDVMPRTAYRYAIEKMPKEMRETAMKK